MTPAPAPCPVNGKHMSAAHEKACPVCSPRPSAPSAPTPSAEELDALEKRIDAALPEVVNPWTYSRQTWLKEVLTDSKDAIKALRHQVLALQQEVTRQTALKNQAMRLNEENPCGG